VAYNLAELTELLPRKPVNPSPVAP
jgi:hypothetical protein